MAAALVVAGPPMNFLMPGPADDWTPLAQSPVAQCRAGESHGNFGNWHYMASAWPTDAPSSNQCESQNGQHIMDQNFKASLQAFMAQQSNAGAVDASAFTAQQSNARPADASAAHQMGPECMDDDLADGYEYAPIEFARIGQALVTLIDQLQRQLSVDRHRLYAIQRAQHNGMMHSSPPSSPKRFDFRKQATAAAAVVPVQSEITTSTSSSDTGFGLPPPWEPPAVGPAPRTPGHFHQAALNSVAPIELVEEIPGVVEAPPVKSKKKKNTAHGNSEWNGDNMPCRHDLEEYGGPLSASVSINQFSDVPSWESAPSKSAPSKPIISTIGSRSSGIELTEKHDDPTASPTVGTSVDTVDSWSGSDTSRRSERRLWADVEDDDSKLEDDVWREIDTPAQAEVEDDHAAQVEEDAWRGIDNPTQLELVSDHAAQVEAACDAFFNEDPDDIEQVNENTDAIEQKSGDSVGPNSDVIFDDVKEKSDAIAPKSSESVGSTSVSDGQNERDEKDDKSERSWSMVAKRSSHKSNSGSSPISSEKKIWQKVVPKEVAPVKDRKVSASEVPSSGDIKKLFGGVWLGKKGEQYIIDVDKWVCEKKSWDFHHNYKLRPREDLGLIYWQSANFVLDLRELKKNPNVVAWQSAQDGSTKWLWQRAGTSNSGRH